MEQEYKGELAFMTLQTYVTLSQVLENTCQQLIKNKIVIYDNKLLNNFDYDKHQLLAFNSLIATGYNVITVLNDKELIKTNFNYDGNNTNPILDFNPKVLNDLLITGRATTQKTFL